MSLLVDMVSGSLDEAYEQAARRGVRRPAGPDTRWRRPSAAAMVALVVLGVLSGAAAAELRGVADGGAGLRASLVQEIQQRTTQYDALDRRSADLQAEVDLTRDAVLRRDADGREQAARLAALELAAAVSPVTGPGVVAEVDDRPGSAEQSLDVRGGSAGDGRVTDRQLQELVNALWGAGAEAVSVNGLRLSARTAIRSAGEAVLVDFRPLSPPYVVEAIGDPAALELSFVDSAAGRGVSTLASLLGQPLQVRRAEALVLVAASEGDLRAVRPEDGP